ncbi:hypothetical protein AB0L88_09090 [Saccharopolyspora shandongensis]|uniref:hypothetical protein n=1 Tax=Saccharopolyspora shandongensis TaxID=418495 RepID=UPI003442FA98
MRARTAGCRFDEVDGVIYFDDVEVPWERVFVNQDIALPAKQFHGTPAHVHHNYQCNIRLMVKMQFLAALAHRITGVNITTNFPPGPRDARSARR